MTREDKIEFLNKLRLIRESNLFSETTDLDFLRQEEIYDWYMSLDDIQRDFISDLSYEYFIRR